jgi:hypothetical protein
MIRRTTWVVLGIFLLLLLAVLVWPKITEKYIPVEPTPTTAIQLPVLDVGNREIIGIKISNHAGAEISFERESPNAAWLVLGQPAESADQEQIENVSIRLSYLMIDRLLPTEPPLDALGLVPPAYTILVTLDNGKQVKLFMGNLVPTGGGYYIKVDDSPAAVVNQADLDVITSNLSNPPLFPTSTPQLTLTLTPTITETQTTIASPTP